MVLIYLVEGRRVLLAEVCNCLVYCRLDVVQLICAWILLVLSPRRHKESLQVLVDTEVGLAHVVGPLLCDHCFFCEAKEKGVNK